MYCRTNLDAEVTQLLSPMSHRVEQKQKPSPGSFRTPRGPLHESNSALQPPPSLRSLQRPAAGKSGRLGKGTELSKVHVTQSQQSPTVWKLPSAPRFAPGLFPNFVHQHRHGQPPATASLAAPWGWSPFSSQGVSSDILHSIQHSPRALITPLRATREGKKRRFSRCARTGNGNGEWSQDSTQGFQRRMQVSQTPVSDFRWEKRSSGTHPGTTIQ